jgi:hypothetical protein
MASTDADESIGVSEMLYSRDGSLLYIFSRRNLVQGNFPSPALAL